MDNTKSAIYIGEIFHQRFSPRHHGFKYKVFMMYLNLDELRSLFNGCRLWSYQRRNLAWFRRADYYGDAQVPLKECIADLVFKATGKRPQGSICMLTNMRYFGYCFNPVTFYYCFAADSNRLQAMVSHITNTPWGEDYAYVHDFEKESTSNHHNTAAFRFDKGFHVSPFMPMDIHYDWSFSMHDEDLLIHMQNLQSGRQVFNATLDLKRMEISTSRLDWLLLSYPFMTLKVIAAIYWN
ncbi:MAG: DUF1365 domain-containing protein, partial [Methylotenera sp.]|nr:DUF1365 domain-containing protein [Methylotenera sp.]